MNILITAVSRRVALVKYFKRALKEADINGKIIATDTNPRSPALYFSDKYYTVPLSSSPDYIKKIKEICLKEEIKLLVPTIDEELPTFGKYSNEFSAIGTKVLISEEKTGSICLDKYSTFKFFMEHNLPFVKTYLPEDIDPKNIKYPLFIKPRRGRGSIGAHAIQNEKEFFFFKYYVKDAIIQDFLHGKEYTIDVLSDFNGNVISVVPRERVVIRSGVCDQGITLKDTKLIDTAVRVTESLKIIGPANLQCKVDNGSICFFEVNPRFSGAIQLTIESGADFPAMILNMVNGIPMSSAIGDFKDRYSMISYENSLYMDENNAWVSK